ncbi:membrane protein [Pectobacterium phage vB_PcaM_CBB]|uniref:Putative membrane protein n=1 Tax=Pectobacterium phage vB_PcaM_CBB TaxID=2772511 RepID=A0A1L2CV39_9CAUD|nr:membrane protein [Pectobacterium phage vB_PcaM_CBB]AMM43869.1 putative membrane protein [Pectobacterium phage vB_PcaM_CBB]
MYPQITEIFTFDESYIYQFILLGGITLEGAVIDARDDGIVLNGLQHIPTDKILYFVPLKKLE